jgi:glycosyltransferase involved in cell wall biosynthesis
VQKVNILQVSPYFAPGWAYGGPVKVSFEICTELARRGHNVVVFTSDSIGASSRINTSKDISNLEKLEVRYFKNLSNWLAFSHHLFFTPGLVVEAARRVRKFDIIHMTEYRTLQNVIIYYYAQKYNIPYILQGHGSIPRRMSKIGLKYLYDNLWGYNILKNASKVLALTSTESEQYKNMGIQDNKIEIIPNGVNLNEFDNLPAKGEFKLKYGLKNVDRTILFLGRINPIKGIDLLVKAYSKLLNQLNDIKLVIVGPDDGYLAQLKQLIFDLKIENKVIVTGPLYGKDKLAAFVDAELYVLPSLSEGFPVSVLESCACGTPVIITKECGITDIINSRVGLVISYDENQLMDTICLLLSDEQMRKDMGEQGKLLVRERFSWSSIVNQLEGIYMDCLVGKQNS